jgi:hypothetical protein
MTGKQMQDIIEVNQLCLGGVVYWLDGPPFENRLAEDAPDDTITSSTPL